MNVKPMIELTVIDNTNDESKTGYYPLSDKEIFLSNEEHPLNSLKSLKITHEGFANSYEYLNVFDINNLQIAKFFMGHLYFTDVENINYITIKYRTVVMIDDMIFNQNYDLLDYNTFHEYLNITDKYSDEKGEFFFAYKFYVLNSKTRDYRKAMNIFGNEVSDLAYYYKFNYYIRKVIDNKHSTNSINNAIHEFSVAYITLNSLKEPKNYFEGDELFEREKEIMEYYSYLLANNMTLLKVAKEKNEFADNLFLIYCENNKFVLPTIIAVKEGRPVFDINGKLVSYLDLKQDLFNTLYNLRNHLDSSRSIDYIYGNVKKMLKNNISFINEKKEPNYDFGGLSKEQIDYQAWENYAIEKGLFKSLDVRKELEVYVSQYEILKTFEKAVNKL